MNRVPLLAGLATAFAGLVNVASALTPELPLRLRSLLALAPAADVRLAHALALPAGLALLGVAWPLAKRRRRALHLAIALLLAAGLLNILKGLDLEEALLSWGVALVLWRARSAFWVRHATEALPQVLIRCAVIAGGAIITALIAAVVAGGTPADALRGLALSGTHRFDEHFEWLPLALGVLGAGSAAVIGALLLAPLRPQRVADALDRRRAAALVRRHGTDTLSAFKLRDDLVRRWSPDGRAFVAYRIHAGTLLLAGDPVGPLESYEPLLVQMRDYARDHGLTIGALGASETFADAAQRAGLRSLYLGDEAMVRTGEMDLSGGPRKSLRKAVNRVARNGYRAELQTVADLTPDTLAELERVSAQWRDGAEERGFSMAHHTLVDDLLPDALVLTARDAGGRVRGFLHFVPVCGARVVSLGFMRRERDTPNGLTEFMVVAAASELAARGIEEFSLNFIAGG
ncbi:MAG TPA: phosphatidylglycerol lysyltransferase domain-containing protein, partial [Solirubrobacteraceae bacterium]|nr:phosphatidylglycerol lysyltransferase domain-containing protein [Solirubrobacteraceae bacterium]